MTLKKKWRKPKLTFREARPMKKKGTEWICWHNQRSGNRTTRAHVASNFLQGRTLCGWTIGDLVAPARMEMPRCQACAKEVNERTTTE